jgi:A/G-specific adenine glycosylase
MLQQTRVSAALPYYARFLKRFPDVDALATAPEAELLEAWSGLGYYRRARQMQQAARRVVLDYDGQLPDTYEGLRSLPGIGDYTAAAIASIVWGLSHVVVDGNVLRVFSRLLDEPGEIAAQKTRGRIRRCAQQVLEAAGPGQEGTFNQALMELGATLCLSRRPQCLLCPVAKLCRARQNGTQEQRPVKRKDKRKEELELAVAVIRRRDALLLRQRPNDAPVMPDFWELPEMSGQPLHGDPFSTQKIRLGKPLGTFRHSITFRSYLGTVFSASRSGRVPRGWRWIAPEELARLPLTTITRKALAVCKRARQPNVNPAKPENSPQLFPGSGVSD